MLGILGIAKRNAFVVELHAFLYFACTMSVGIHTYLHKELTKIGGIMRMFCFLTPHNMGGAHCHRGHVARTQACPYTPARAKQGVSCVRKHYCTQDTPIGLFCMQTIDIRLSINTILCSHEVRW